MTVGEALAVVAGSAVAIGGGAWLVHRSRKKTAAAAEDARVIQTLQHIRAPNQATVALGQVALPAALDPQAAGDNAFKSVAEGTGGFVGGLVGGAVGNQKAGEQAGKWFADNFAALPALGIRWLQTGKWGWGT